MEVATRTRAGVEITCPHCQSDFLVEEALSHQFERQLSEKLDQERKQLREIFARKATDLKRREKELEERRQKENELFLEKLQREKAHMENQLRLKFKQDYDEQLTAKQKELKEVEEQLIQLKQAEIENARLKRTLSQQQQELELEFEKKLSDRLKHMEDDIARRERQRAELTLLEKEKKLEDQKKLIAELKRRSEQGSQQLQGEVQELAIEEWLLRHFPFDKIEEIKKGSRGADCLQIVNTRTRQGCGSIYYESKRTKEFSPSWIDKFKKDMLVKGADVGVLITQTMPKNMERMGISHGVWICTYEEFKGLCFVLRDMLVRISEVADAQINREDKMHLLYHYLTSGDFKMQVEAIVDGFTQMHSDLQREKNAMMRLWKQREKQIQRILETTSGMFGSIKGIAGSALPEIDLLQLPGN